MNIDDEFDAARGAALARRFRALGDPARVSLVARLARAGEARVGELVAGSGLAQATVSHHLRILREAGIVEARGSRNAAAYRVVPGALAELAALTGEAHAALSPLVTLTPQDEEHAPS
jgi:ArsR family transcriptional regulator